MFDDTHSISSEGRFRAVDSVAEKIFDRMPDLAGHEADETDTPTSDQQAPADTQAPESFLAKTERMMGAFVQALDERGKELQAAATESDISFYAARRRSQLPDGVELLQGAPSAHSEDEMLASIRSLIDQQDAEQYAERIEKNREMNRQSLPPLEPQNLWTEEREPRPTPEPIAGLATRIRTSLRQTFRKDLFLACALSVWSALTLAIFIEPSVSGMLLATSLFLLFVANCLSPGKRHTTQEFAIVKTA